jgi:hypothetical protein
MKTLTDEYKVDWQNVLNKLGVKPKSRKNIRGNMKPKEILYDIRVNDGITMTQYMVMAYTLRQALYYCGITKNAENGKSGIISKNEIKI